MSSRIAMLAVAGSLAMMIGAGSLSGYVATAAAAVNCETAPNPVVCENALPGTPPAQWEVSGVGDPTIQGYATQMSVNAGRRISFKIRTPSNNYTITIYRLGWYGGDGARQITVIRPSARLPQSQPPCLSSSRTGLIDCGNWSISGSWDVPADAVSGIYLAKLTRQDSQDPGGASDIPFVVRNDASRSPILMSTNDATWQAYNDYGGNSLYTCTVRCPRGHPLAYRGAFAVSYNRPWSGALNTDGGRSYLWHASYQMVQWLERQGYDVSYTTDVQLAGRNPLIRQHRVLLFAGHDEYWSGSERANVTAARNAGVNLAFFSGNEIFWKTRWGASLSRPSSPSRTLISYKETHFNRRVDPADPPVWTGAWADPRFAPRSDGGLPGNALSGQQFAVNSGTADIRVPYRYHALPVWAHTAVAALAPGGTVTLAPGAGTLGYEWDLDVDNGFRPAGEFDMSSTTVQHAQVFADYGSLTRAATATHHLTLYRARSGALVFGAGTVQWSWGLDRFNAWGQSTTEPGATPPDPNMEQFTVNVLALMGARPGTLQSGLVQGPGPRRMRGPRAAVRSPRRGARLADGRIVRIRGTAAAGRGAVVSGVEVSTDGGRSWHPAAINGADRPRVSWSYRWIVHGFPRAALRARAVDGYGDLGPGSRSIRVAVRCPCSLWGPHMGPKSVPFGYLDAGQRISVELGMRFRARIASQLLGIRFYRSRANTGVHVGSVWTNRGHLLAQARFRGGRRVGWQTVWLRRPLRLAARHTYVVGYFAPNGHYAYTIGWFYRRPSPTPLGGAVNSNGPWSAVLDSGRSTNGLYRLTGTPAFPNRHFEATNYWVEPIVKPARR